MNKTDLFKVVVPSILETKKDPFTTREEKRDFVRDNSFIILKALSMHADCVMQANEMNLNYNLDGDMKFDFLLNTVRGYKRPFNYAKSIKYDSLDVIQEYYGVNAVTAKQYHDLLTSEQISEIKKRLYKGGTKNE